MSEVIADMRRWGELSRPTQALAMNPADVNDSVRACCRALNMELFESTFVQRGTAFVIDLEKLRAAAL